MQNHPLISVIVPCYKVETYLRKCVDSILAQTYRNLEIILVDDGSPDNCGEICDEYMIKDPRVKVIHKTNGGLSDARNAGMSIAKGEYISFVDSDDYIAADMYEMLIQAGTKHEADIMECNAAKVYPGKELEIEDDSPEVEVFDAKSALEQLITVQKFKPTVWNKLYKASIISDLEFPVGRVNEDEFWTYRVFAKSEKILSHSKSLYFYLQRSDSIMNVPYNPKRLDGLAAQIDRLEYIKQNFHQLFNLTQKRLFLSCLFHYDSIHSNIQCDSLQIYRKFIHTWVKDNYHILLKNPTMGKHKIWLVLFRHNPELTYSIRCLLKRAD